VIAPLAWLPAYAFSLAVQWAVPFFDYRRNPTEHFVGTLSNVIAGLVVLWALNAALVRLLPKDADWAAE
jgi:hypothetical protein